jgi:hypothetical protein
MESMIVLSYHNHLPGELAKQLAYPSTATATATRNWRKRKTQLEECRRHRDRNRSVAILGSVSILLAAYDDSICAAVCVGRVDVDVGGCDVLNGGGGVFDYLKHFGDGKYSFEFTVSYCCCLLIFMIIMMLILLLI